MAKKKKPQENTHDKLFKQTFSQEAVMQDYISHFLPKDLAEGIDLQSLELDNGEYIDEELREHFSDIVYTCKFGGKAMRIALLLEHKSSPPKYPHFQLLRYMLNIWERDITDKRALTPVVPVIIYHGKTKWKSRPLHSYFKGLPEVLKTYLPDFSYEITDLNVVSNKEIMPLHRTALYNLFLAFKNIRSRNRLREIFPLLFINIDEIGRNQVEVFLVYITKNTELEPKEVRRIALESPTAKDYLMTLYDKLIAEGETKGEKKGEHKKALYTVQKCHENDVPVENAALFSGLPLEEVQELYARLDKGEDISPK